MKIELNNDELNDVYTCIYAMRASWSKVEGVEKRLDNLEGKFLDALNDSRKQEEVPVTRSEDLLHRDLQEVMEDFNWKSVTTAMTALDWTWYDSALPPTKDRMMDTVIDLGNVVIEHYLVYKKRYSASTGGFRVSITDDGQLSIDFIVTSKAKTFW